MYGLGHRFGFRQRKTVLSVAFYCVIMTFRRKSHTIWVKFKVMELPTATWCGGGTQHSWVRR